MLQKSIFINLFIGVLLIGLASSCKNEPIAQPYTITQSAKAENAMIVSAHPLATQVGLDVLKHGGNAVDATIAVQFALAVVYPRAGNIGGGGFMVYRSANGETDALDYREKAPGLAHADMYLDSLGNVVPGLSTAGRLAVGVPGTVDGMVKAHQKYGRIKNFGDLVAPAVKLAREGYSVSIKEAKRLEEFKAQFEANNENAAPFVKQKKWQVGDLLKQAELANTLERIQMQGEKGFYEGKTAQLLVDELHSQNGIISLQDLKDYDAQWRTPISGEYKEYKIISMPPPSSGGIALLQMLELIENYTLQEMGFHTPESMHLIVEAERRAYADRAHFLGDSDFYPVPVDSLLEQSYLIERMSDYSADSATLSTSVEAGDFEISLESFETTHTSVIDAEGNACSVTTTINSNFGSKVVVGGAGFFLNNEMDDFSAKPGVPNLYGLVGAKANAIAPGKRMLSSMTPTIIEKNGQLFMVVGSPGGSTIITAVFQTFLNVAEFNMSLEEAVWAKRFHHQWLPDVIMHEAGCFDEVTRAALIEKGHSFEEKKYIALVKAIQVLDDGTLHGVGDNRSEDHAEGY